MKPSRIEVYIDELVLHGFAPGDKHAIAESLHTEMLRLLNEGALWTDIGENADIGVAKGEFTTVAQESAVNVGARAARAIVQELQT